MLSSTTLPAAAEPAVAVVRAQSQDRFGSPWWNHLKAWFGTPSKRRLAYAALQISKVRHWEEEFDKLSDAEVRQKGLHLRGRARGGESLDALLAEAFGLICVASKRSTGLRPFDVQLAAGVV